MLTKIWTEGGIIHESYNKKDYGVEVRWQAIDFLHEMDWLFRKICPRSLIGCKKIMM